MTLQQWVDASPNRSASNTLIQTIGTDGRGRVLYYSYRWNLRPVDPSEPDIYTTPDGNVISQGAAHALLSASH